METQNKIKKLEDSLDSNLFSRKIYNKVYLFLAFWLVLTPIMETLFACAGLTLIIIFQIMFISTIYIITKCFEIIFNIKDIKIHFKSITDIIFVILFLMFLMTSIINGVFNTNFFFGLCYFLCFVLILNIDKKYFKLLILTFVIEMIFDTFLGIIDFSNELVPGFCGDDNYAISLQFGNPNWSAVVMIIAAAAALWLVYNYKKLWQKILLFVGFLIIVTGLFIGGSYAPEFSLFMFELAILLYLWIKNKKCPWWIFGGFLATIFLSFFVWWFPSVREVTTAAQNFCYESLAVIDGILNTHLVKYVSTLCNKLFGSPIFETVAGSDGWTRGNLTSMALNAIFASPKSFLFGYGSAYIYEIRVHNCFLAVWLEFGFITFAVYIAIMVLLAIKFAKSKKTNNLVFAFIAFYMLVFESLFCCIEPYCYTFFVIAAAVFYRLLCDAERHKD